MIVCARVCVRARVCEGACVWRQIRVSLSLSLSFLLSRSRSLALALLLSLSLARALSIHVYAVGGRSVAADTRGDMASLSLCASLSSRRGLGLGFRFDACTLV